MINPEAGGLAPLRDTSDRRAATVVRTGFAVMALAAIAHAAWAALAVPFHDDWDMLRVTMPDGAPAAAWFRESHNEHRIPLAKLVHAAVDPVAGLDRRPTIALDLALLLGASAILVRAARRARGRSAAADLVLPAALLHPGHHVDFTWAFAVVWVLVVALFSAALGVLSGVPGRRPAAASWILGLAVLGLSLSGVPGQVLALALGTWIVAGTLLGQRVGGDGARGGPGLPAFLLALAACAVLAAAAATHEARTGSRLAWGLEVLRTAAEFAGTATGPAQDAAGRVRGALLLGTALLAGALLARSAARESAERGRRLGILAAAAGTLAVALAVGVGRGAGGPGAGGEPRWSHLAALILVAAHFAALHAGPGRAARFVPWILGAILAAGFPGAAASARRHAEERLGACAALERDVRAGLPLRVLTRRHSAVVLDDPLRADYAGLLFYWLAVEHVGPFSDPGHVPDLSEERFGEEALSGTPSWAPGVTFDGGSGVAPGPDPQVHWFLPEARPVAGVRLTVAVTTGDGADANLQVYWSGGRNPDYAEERSRTFRLRSGETFTFTAWIEDAVDRIRIDPDYRPCRFVLGAVVVLRAR